MATSDQIGRIPASGAWRNQLNFYLGVIQSLLPTASSGGTEPPLVTNTATLPVTARRIRVSATATGKILTLPVASAIGPPMQTENSVLWLYNIGAATWRMQLQGTDTFNGETNNYIDLTNGDTLAIVALRTGNQDGSGNDIWAYQIVS